MSYKNTNVFGSIIHYYQRMETTQIFINYEWTNKILYIHMIGCSPAIKGSGVLIHAAIWMDLENMLSEKSQAQRLYIV